MLKNARKTTVFSLLTFGKISTFFKKTYASFSLFFTVVNLWITFSYFPTQPYFALKFQHLLFPHYPQVSWDKIVYNHFRFVDKGNIYLNFSAILIVDSILFVSIFCTLTTIHFFAMFIMTMLFKPLFAHVFKSRLSHQRACTIDACR